MNKKRIVCFGDSNTWGYSAETGGRFEDDERWTQVMQTKLGQGYMVMEEGISGRTTVFEDPLNEGLRGMDYLFTILMTHSPLDVLIIMLGTNDCKQRFSASPQNISDGVERLIRKAKQLEVWKEKPHILVVSPVIMDKKCYGSEVAGEMGEGSVEKSEKLPELMAKCAEKNGCAYLDSNDYAGVNTIDYMHFDLAGHQKLGEAMAHKIQEILED